MEVVRRGPVIYSHQRPCIYPGTLPGGNLVLESGKFRHRTIECMCSNRRMLVYKSNALLYTMYIDLMFHF